MLLQRRESLDGLHNRFRFECRNPVQTLFIFFCLVLFVNFISGQGGEEDGADPAGFGPGIPVPPVSPCSGSMCAVRSHVRGSSAPVVGGLHFGEVDGLFECHDMILSVDRRWTDRGKDRGHESGLHPARGGMKWSTTGAGLL